MNRTQVSKGLLLLLGLMVYGAGSAEDVTQKPSIELLEFLGDWETRDGEWLDPLQLLDEIKAEAQQKQDEGQKDD